MKKLSIFILFFITLFSAAFAERYPIEMEYAFLHSCIGEKEDMEGYCTCALKKIEEKYTVKEFVTLYSQNPAKFKKKLVKEIFPLCVDKLKIE